MMHDGAAVALVGPAHLPLPCQASARPRILAFAALALVDLLLLSPSGALRCGRVHQEVTQVSVSERQRTQARRRWRLPASAVVAHWGRGACAGASSVTAVACQCNLGRRGTSAARATRAGAKVAPLWDLLHHGQMRILRLKWHRHLQTWWSRRHQMLRPR